MAFSEIRGAIWQKQGADLVKILPETAAVQVSYNDMHVEEALDELYQQIAALEGVASDALVFKGVVNSAADLPTAGYKVGDTYKVNTAGTYKGIVCEPGDALIAVAETGANSDWVVLQANIDGAVTGPASATDGAIALFDGATGKVIKAGDTLSSVKQSIKANADAIDALETRAGAIEGRLDTAESDIDDLEDRMTAVEGKNATQDSDISDLKTRMTAAESKNTAQDGRLGDLEAADVAHDNSIAALGERVDAVESKNTAQDTAINSLTDRMGTAEGSIATNTSDISGLKTRVTAVENTNTEQDTAISGLQTRMTAAETKNTAQDTAISGLQTRMTTAEGDITAIKAKDTAQDGRLDAIEAKDVEQDGRLDALEAATCEWVALAPANATNSQIASAAAPLKNYGLVIVPKVAM